MLEQLATVVAVRGNQLVLETQAQSSCQSCSVNKGCGTSLLSKVVGQKVIHFELENTLDARTGEQVVLGLPENAVVRGSLLIYIVPVLVLMLAAFAGDALLALDAASRDLKIAGFSLSAMAVGIFISRSLFRRADSMHNYMPVLLRKEIVLRSEV